MTNLKIYTDSREQNSQILKMLDNVPDVELVIQTLEIGDYVVSDRRGFERKTPPDFLGSLFGSENSEKGKIFRQCRDLVGAYEIPELLIEGELPELFVRNTSPNAIFGSLQKILESGCGIRFTGSAEGTVAYLVQKARDEQEGRRIYFSPHAGKTRRTLAEQQEYIISAIPNVGGKTAVDLLKTFGSVDKVICATEEELTKIEGIGKKTAGHIRSVVGSDYK